MCKYMSNDCTCIKLFLSKTLKISIHHGPGKLFNCVRDTLYVKINVCILQHFQIHVSLNMLAINVKFSSTLNRYLMLSVHLSNYAYEDFKHSFNCLQRIIQQCPQQFLLLLETWRSFFTKNSYVFCLLHMNNQSIFKKRDFKQ